MHREQAEADLPTIVEELQEVRQAVEDLNVTLDHWSRLAYEKPQVQAPRLGAWDQFCLWVLGTVVFGAAVKVLGDDINQLIAGFGVAALVFGLGALVFGLIRGIAKLVRWMRTLAGGSSPR